MTCYCGLGTRNNKLRWAIFGTLAIIALCLLIASEHAFGKCQDSVSRISGMCSALYFSAAFWAFAHMFSCMIGMVTSPSM